MKLFTKVAFVLLLVSSFFSGYALGNLQQSFRYDQVEQKVTQPVSGSISENSTDNEDIREIVIVFTVDEQRKIHVLNISGGHNMLTDFIKRSLEGRAIDNDNAIPGINYVMTLRFPSSV